MFLTLERVVLVGLDQLTDIGRYEMLTYSIKQNHGRESNNTFYVILWNDNRIVTDFGDYPTARAAIEGANRDSLERQDTPAAFKLPRFKYNEIPYHIAELSNVTWHPYGDDPSYASVNSRGWNGYIVGTVIKGSTFNRLFHATSTTQWKTDVEKRLDYIPIDQIRFNENGAGSFMRHTCG